MELGWKAHYFSISAQHLTVTNFFTAGPPATAYFGLRSVFCKSRTHSEFPKVILITANYKIIFVECLSIARLAPSPRLTQFSQDSEVMVYPSVRSNSDPHMAFTLLHIYVRLI